MQYNSDFKIFSKEISPSKIRISRPIILSKANLIVDNWIFINLLIILNSLWFTASNSFKVSFKCLHFHYLSISISVAVIISDLFPED